MLRRLWLSLLLVAIGGLSACGEEPARQLRMGFNLWPGYTPLFIAEHQAFLDSNQVELFDYANTNEMLRAMALGSIDGGGLTTEELLHASDLGLDLVVLVVTDISNGADAIIAREPYPSMAELKGHRIGVEPGALGALMMLRAASSVGLAPTDFDIVDVPLHQQLSSYQSLAVDAMITFEPVRTQLLDAGGHEVFTSADIPGEIVDLLVINRRALERNPEAIQHLIDAWFAGVDYLSAHPAEAMAIIDRRLKLGAVELKAAMAGLEIPNRPAVEALLKQRGRALLPTMQRIEQLMWDAGYIKSKNTLSAFFLPDEKLNVRGR